MVNRLLLLLVSLQTLHSSDTIIVMFPTMLNTKASINGNRYAHTNETTVSHIVSTGKEYYLKHMSQQFNEEVKEATFFLTASYFCTQPSFTCYEESKPLEQDNTIDEIKKMYRTDRFTLNYGFPKKEKRKRLASTQ